MIKLCTTVSSDQVISLDKMHSMSAGVEYHSTETLNSTYLFALGFVLLLNSVRETFVKRSYHMRGSGVAVCCDDYNRITAC